MVMDKVTLYLILAILNSSCTVLCFNHPVASPNYVKQAASNQASTNERFHSTCSYDSTQTEYINVNEKYENPRMKIICKIKSSAPISVQEDRTLIEKETTGIEQWSDYLSSIREKSNSMANEKNHRKLFSLPLDTDQNREFFSRFMTRGKCIGKCEDEKASMLTSMLVTRTDVGPFTLYRSDLKRMKHYQRPNDLIENPKLESTNLKDYVSNIPSSILIDKEPAASADLDKLHKNHRVRRQLRFIPASTSKRNRPVLHSPLYHQTSHGSRKQKNPSNFDSALLNSLMGVFDGNQPEVASSFQRLEPNQFVIAQPKYIDDTKIIPSPFGFYGEVDSFKPEGPQFVKNTPRNLSSFGESQYVPTTGTSGNNERAHIIHDYFLPTVRPLTTPKSSKTRTKNNYYIVGDKSKLNNHQLDSFEKSILSTPNNLHQETLGTPTQRESYKYHGKDTKYDRYGAKYIFNYDVHDDTSGNYFGHHETRNEHITNGNYHVRLPDGRLQRVTYYVDEKGYHANVAYD